MVHLQPVLRPRRQALWLDEVDAVEPNARTVDPLVGTLTTDICIVGGGYTGLWTALRIKALEPSRSVTLLEADICGSGASGRNGGMVGTWWGKLSTLERVCGTDDGHFMAEEVYNAIGEIESFVAEHGIQAHFRRSGRLQVATSGFQMDTWEPGLRKAEALGYGKHFTRLTREEIQRRSGSPIYCGGYYEDGPATVQPALLARGMRKVAIEKGVQIFEGTPVLRIQEGDPVILRTPQGTVIASKVVLATNAWTAAIPELRRHMIVVSSDIVATAPIPDRLSEAGWIGGESIADCRIMVHYSHVTHDNRISFGRGSGSLAYLGRLTTAFDGNPAKAAEVEQGLRKFYPNLADAPITHRWGGPIDRSRSGTLIFGHLTGSPNIVYGIGYSGSGVSQTVLGGKILASTVLERNDRYQNVQLNKGPVILYPPDPVKFFGGLFVRSVLTKREEGEEDNIRPRRPTVWISKLAYPTLPWNVERRRSKVGR